MTKNNSIIAILFLCIGIGVSFLFQYVYGNYQAVNFSNGTILRLTQNTYPLIDPLLLCSLEQRSTAFDSDLQSDISDFVHSRVKEGTLENMSVYIQEYGKNKWLGINENERYDPASLLKVPLMIAYYQIAEKRPEILSEQTSFNGYDQNVGEYFRSSNDIIPNKSYSVDNLIKSMIVNSDNTATVLLSNYVDKNSLISVYTDLGLPTPPNDPSLEYISAKSYAYFFRILYNSTYLSREYSEKALELLAKSHLPGGIAGAVPKSVTVADKFGERTVYDDNGVMVDRELHDCGIVYAPKSPYLICIMSKGKDFNQLAKNIGDLSALVYDKIGK